MDVSGGLPAVLIRMLVMGEPGKVSLLKALPKTWPQGTIEGLLCRGQVEVKKLEWKPGSVEVTLASPKAQRLVLEVPRPIKTAKLRDASATLAAGDAPNRRTLTLKAGQPATVVVEFQ